jgi:exosome complex component RRP43
LGVNTGSLTHCNGSAVVRVGNTAVVCGVRAEILTAEEGTVDEYTASANAAAEVGDENEDEDGYRDGEEEEEERYKEISALRLLVPNVELCTGSTPALLPGNAPSAFAQTLVTRIRNLLLSTKVVGARQLRIVHAGPDASLGADTGGPNPNREGDEVMQEGGEGEGEAETETHERLVKGYWTLYIDTMFISLDGNAFDAAWLAILSALSDTRLPHAYFDDELEMILCSDDPARAKKLELAGLPVPSTFAVFESDGRWGEDDDGDGEGEGKSWVLSDPDTFEESVCQESVTVVVDCSASTKAQIRKIEKSGGGVVDRDVMKVLVKRSLERWKEWKKTLSTNS